MIGTVETKKNAVDFEYIQKDDRPFQYRIPKINQESTLRGEIEMLGLLQPIAVEEIEPRQFVIIDGYRRFDAINEIREAEGGWDDIPAIIFPTRKLSLREKFELLKERNMEGNYRYNIFEKARCINSFIAMGLNKGDVMQICALTKMDLVHLATLRDADNTLVSLLEGVNLSLPHAASLTTRYKEWVKSPYAKSIPHMIERILTHLKTERVTDTSWDFLLDFYWSKKKPFMV
jgi:hypothetical protein